MAEAPTIQNPAGAGSQGPRGGGPGSKPETNDVKVGKLFSAAGLERGIYDIIVDKDGPRIFGWRVREKSQVSIRGKNLWIYNQICLLIDGKPFLHRGIDRASDGSRLSFQVTDDIKGAYKDGKLIVLELVDSENPANNRYLTERLRYRGESEQEEKERKAKGGQEKGKADQSLEPKVFSDVLNSVIGGVPSAIAQGFNADSQTQKSVGASTTQAAGGIKAKSQTMAAQDEGGGSIGGTESEESKVLSSTNEISTGGRTISSGGTVSGTVTSQTTSQSRTVASGQKSVTGIVSGSASIGGGAVSAEGTVSGSVGTAANQRVEAQSSAQASINSQSSVAGGASGGITADIKAAASTQAQSGTKQAVTAKADLKSETRVTAPSAAKVEMASRANLKTLGEHLSKNPQIIPDAGKRGEIMEALSTGNIDGLSSESKKVLKQYLSALSGGEIAAPREIISAARDVQGHAEPGKGAPKNAGPKIGTSETPHTQGAGEYPLKGKGSIDGIGDNNNREAAKPPAGLKSLLDNNAELGRKLNLPNGQPEENKPTGGSAGLANGIDAAKGAKGPDENEPGGQIGKSRGGGTGGPVAPPLGQSPDLANLNQQGAPQDQDNQNAANPGEEVPSKDENENDENNEEGEDEDQDIPQPVPQLPVGAAAAALGPQAGLAAKAANTLASGKAGQAAVAQVTGKLWWYGYGTSVATLFSGLDFLLGAFLMDLYWISHSRQPLLFPMKGWQKAVTIFAHVVPIIILTFFFTLLMAVGCNYPLPLSVGKSKTYSLTVVGAFIGDDCKYFDLTSLSSGNSSAATTASK